MPSPSQPSPIADFLARRRIAFVGVSRDEKDFSRGLFRELRRRGYDAVPVHPHAASIDGERCFARVQDVSPPVDGVFVMTPAASSERVVRDSAEAGVRRIWLHRGAGAGSVSPAALALCRERGISVVPGACPYMFLPETAFFHRLHGGLLRLLGRHPDRHRSAA